MVNSSKEFDISRIIGLNETEGVEDSFRITEITRERNHKTHNFDCYEFMFFTEGEAIVKTSGMKISAKKNTVVFLHVGDVCEITPVGKCVKYMSLKFSYRFMFPFEERTITFLSIEYTKRKIYTDISERDSGLVYDVFRRIMGVNKKNMTNYDRFYIITAINWILINFIVITDQSTRIERKSPIEKVLFRVNNSYNKKISLAELAEMIHVSPTYLSFLFKKEVGVSFQEYVKQKRLGHAYDLLISTGSNIADIAYRSGFNSVSQFSREFKKKYGMAPANYKNKILEERKKY